MKIQTGVQKTPYSLKDYSHERTFGAVDPKILPEEYNADLALSFPDQNADGLYNACTGYTVSEMGQDENGELFDPKFTYEKTLAIENAPFGSPCQVRDALKSSRTFGLKRKQNDSTVVRGAYFNVDKAPDYFDGIRSALYLNQIARRPVLAASPWFNEWHSVGSSGILKAPSKYVWDAGTIGHCYKICGWKSINNIPYLILKTWQGPDVGDKGYVYLSREICNATFNISGTALYIQSNLSAGEVVRVKIDILQLAIDFIRRLLLITPPTMPPEAPTSPAIESNREKLYRVAYSCLGRDMSPQNLAPNSLACAESLNGVFKEAFGKVIDDGSGLLSTAGLYQRLKNDGRFEEVDNPLAGDIVISPTGLSYKGSAHGHTGVWGNNDVMSNDSDTGKWKDNYTHQAWYNVFQKELGFPVLFFRVRG